MPSIPEYTTVVGVDRAHLDQLRLTWPTWMKHKPSLLQHPMFAFYDPLQVKRSEVEAVLDDHPNLTMRSWDYSQTDARPHTDKWTQPQRVKMLSGFVHCTVNIGTPYWLKLDTDTVAVGCPDWIDPTWFENNPAIVAQGWGYTKPAWQMSDLDLWVEDYKQAIPIVALQPPLKLIPDIETATKLRHKRIISWCGFFSTELSRLASDCALRTGCGYGLPVPSQDGFQWYLATRMQLGVMRVDLKGRGWEHWTSRRNIQAAVERAMA